MSTYSIYYKNIKTDMNSTTYVQNNIIEQNQDTILL